MKKHPVLFFLLSFGLGLFTMNWFSSSAAKLSLAEKSGQIQQAGKNVINSGKEEVKKISK